LRAHCPRHCCRSSYQTYKLLGAVEMQSGHRLKRIAPQGGVRKIIKR
jgi:hypothetical protein